MISTLLGVSYARMPRFLEYDTVTGRGGGVDGRGGPSTQGSTVAVYRFGVCGDMQVL